MADDTPHPYSVVSLFCCSLCRIPIPQKKVPGIPIQPCSGSSWAARANPASVSEGCQVPSQWGSIAGAQGSAVVPRPAPALLQVVSLEGRPLLIARRARSSRCRSFGRPPRIRPRLGRPVHEDIFNPSCIRLRRPVRSPFPSALPDSGEARKARHRGPARHLGAWDS